MPAVHCAHGSHAPLITQCQCGNLALLPVGVFRLSLFDFLNRDAEHLRRGGFVDFPMRPEHFQHPIFIRQPRNDPRFYSGEIRVQQHVSRRCNKSGADELGEGVRHAAEDPIQPISVLRFNQFSRQRKYVPGDVCPG